ncbi:hypothetical protein ACQP25_44430 (plasmid) [Microtetraspora malaysiensis]|uniref:hypothetical protein n=1 Tax=Microtetraspora malaysiensis TaxID=161358 RepID=UPI003D8B9887
MTRTVDIPAALMTRTVDVPAAVKARAGAVARTAAYLAAGTRITDDQAEEIARAVLAHHDEEFYVETEVSPELVEDQPMFRHAFTDCRNRLLAKVADAGYVPVELPRAQLAHVGGRMILRVDVAARGPYRKPLTSPDSRPRHDDAPGG